jgi:hypothetical protein
MARLTDKTTATAVTLNSLVHIVNTGDTSQNSTGSSYKADLGQLGDAMGGYQYYTAVTISSAQILSSNSSPIQILPTPGAGKYYDAKFIVEYTYNTTQYVSANNTVITDGTTNPYVLFALSSYSTDKVFISQSMNGTSSSNGISTNTSLSLKTLTADPTTGNGTMLIKVWYSIRTLG